MEYRALLDRLQDGRFRKLHLSQKALRARMKESGFLADLPATLRSLAERGYDIIAGDLRGQDFYRRRPARDGEDRLRPRPHEGAGRRG